MTLLQLLLYTTVSFFVWLFIGWLLRLGVILWELGFDGADPKKDSVSPAAIVLGPIIILYFIIRLAYGITGAIGNTMNAIEQKTIKVGQNIYASRVAVKRPTHEVSEQEGLLSVPPAEGGEVSLVSGVKS